MYEDPLKVRRGLLEYTDGRCWEYASDLSTMTDELVKLREQQAMLQMGAANENAEQAAERIRVEATVRMQTIAIAKLEGVLAKAAIEAFEFQPLNPEDGKGVTELEALEVLTQFLGFAEGKGERPRM